MKLWRKIRSWFTPQYVPPFPDALPIEPAPATDGIPPEFLVTPPFIFGEPPGGTYMLSLKPGWPPHVFTRHPDRPADDDFCDICSHPEAHPLHLQLHFSPIAPVVDWGDEPWAELPHFYADRGPIKLIDTTDPGPRCGWG